MKIAGAWMTIRKIGCSSTGPAAFSASRTPWRPAMRKAMSELSTGWCLAVGQRHRHVDHRKAERPALHGVAGALPRRRGCSSAAPRRPSPPRRRRSPLPRAPGATISLTSANWPGAAGLLLVAVGGLLALARSSRGRPALGATSSTSMPKTSFSRWRSTRRCSGPCTPTSAPPVAGSWVTVSAPSPSASAASEPDSLTPSRSVTGASTRCMHRRLRPVPGRRLGEPRPRSPAARRRDGRPSPRWRSPLGHGCRDGGCRAGRRGSAARRRGRPAPGRRQAAPAPAGAASCRRACGRRWRRSPPPAASSSPACACSRSRSAAGGGASCRSAFITRTMPLPCAGRADQRLDHPVLRAAPARRGRRPRRSAARGPRSAPRAGGRRTPRDARACRRAPRARARPARRGSRSAVDGSPSR